MPAADMQAPASHVEAPAADVEAPAADIDAPAVSPETSGEPLAGAEAAAGPVEPEPPAIQEEPAEVTPAAPPPPPSGVKPQWLLSLFTPAVADTVDWNRGNYTMVERGGRIESPARSGELKKQLPMVAEGSVLYAASALRGAAPDVAPEGFAHPVFRAGFALAIPLPEAG